MDWKLVLGDMSNVVKWFLLEKLKNIDKLVGMRRREVLQ